MYCFGAYELGFPDRGWQVESFITSVGLSIAIDTKRQSSHLFQGYSDRALHGGKSAYVGGTNWSRA